MSTPFSKQKKIIKIPHAIYAQCKKTPFEIYRKETRTYNGKEYLYEFDNMNPTPEDSCPFAIPSDFRIKSKQIMRARGPRKDTEIKYPKLAKEARAGYISDRTLLETYTLRLTERPLILYSPQERNHLSFTEW